jgi:hypothetical protein
VVRPWIVGSRHSRTMLDCAQREPLVLKRRRSKLHHEIRADFIALAALGQFH